MITFEHLSNFIQPNQRIWLHQFTQKLEANSLMKIEHKLSDFAENWSSHGQKLNAQTTILHNHYLLISVNENIFSASGCSIDKCTHLLKEINEAYDLDLFNRLIIGIYKNNELQFFSKSQIQDSIANGTISSEDFYIDLSISKGSDLKHILKPIHQSWFYPSIRHA